MEFLNGETSSSSASSSPSKQEKIKYCKRKRTSCILDNSEEEDDWVVSKWRLYRTNLCPPVAKRLCPSPVNDLLTETLNSPEDAEEIFCDSDFSYAGQRDNIKELTRSSGEVIYEINWEGAPVYSSYPPFPPAGIMSRVRLTQAESDRLVNRLKNTNLDKFHTLCKMHLSFLLHLPGSHLDDFLGGGEISSGGEGPGTPHATPVTIEKKSHFRHFGKKKVLKEHKTPETSAISQDVIEQMLPLVKYLEENVEHEGLFRKSGHLGRQRLLSKKLHSRLDVRLELENDVYSAHDCASVLKTLLSELPEPLLTERHYLAYCQIPEMEQQPKQLQTLQLLLQLLPAENLYLLRAILSLLHKVAREPSNKMTSDTLGTMFAPHLLMPRKMSPSELQAVAGDLTRTVAFMVDNVPDLFKLPRPLIRDIATYWAQMEQCDDPDPEDPDLVHKPPRGASRDPPRGENPPITTTVTFTDRDATQHAAANTHTEVALAQLYAHVSAMPESSKKRRLLKQFTKANPAQTGVTPVPTSDKHKRTKSFGDSLKKMVGRNHKRRGSSHLLQLHDSADTNNTPYTVTGRYSARLTEQKKEPDIITKDETKAYARAPPHVPHVCLLQPPTHPRHETLLRLGPQRRRHHQPVCRKHPYQCDDPRIQSPDGRPKNALVTAVTTSHLVMPSPPARLLRRRKLRRIHSVPTTVQSQSCEERDGENTAPTGNVRTLS